MALCRKRWGIGGCFLLTLCSVPASQIHAVALNIHASIVVALSGSHHALDPFFLQDLAGRKGTYAYK
jgi:hypothetical protein